MRVPPQLKELASRIPENSPFTEIHGRLLNLFTSNTDEGMMKVLFQFFDPLHYCFTFPDYQLVLTFEEFSELLGVSVLDQISFTDLEETPRPEVIAKALYLKSYDIVANWETRSGVKGFLAKFLMEKARLFFDAMNFQAF